MEAIVLAGGLGTRLRSVVPDVPKPMAPVAGRPFLEILLNFLSQSGFRRVILSTGHMAEKISNHFGQHYAGMELVYCVEDTPLGTGGAIRKASEFCVDSHYFVFNGDSYLKLEINLVDSWWRENRAPVIVAREVPDTLRYGRLETREQQVIQFHPKGISGPGLINGGCYVFAREELNEWPLGQLFSIENEYFPQQVIRRRVDFFVTRGLFIDIGIPSDYDRAQSELAGL